MFEAKRVSRHLAVRVDFTLYKQSLVKLSIAQSQPLDFATRNKLSRLNQARCADCCADC